MGFNSGCICFVPPCVVLRLPKGPQVATGVPTDGESLRRLRCGRYSRFSSPGEKFPRARFVAEGLAGDEALELRAATAAVDLPHAAAEQAVILSAQVVVRIDVGWLSLQRLARRAQGHVSILLEIEPTEGFKIRVQKDVIPGVRLESAPESWQSGRMRRS